MYAKGLTDVGKTRNQNQDAIFYSAEQVGPLPNLCIVADGMGGHNAGEVASKTAINCMRDYILDFNADVAWFIQPDDYLDLMINAAQSAGKAVNKMAEGNPNMAGMGTTLTACVVADGKITIAHIGDSRVYAVSQDNIKQLTTDHTYVQGLLMYGKITAEEARVHPKRHVITRALGIADTCEIDGYVIPLDDTKTIMLCSDGLSNMIEDDELKQIINSAGYAEDRVQVLVDEANNKGGLDNISAILVDIGR